MKDEDHSSPSPLEYREDVIDEQSLMSWPSRELPLAERSKVKQILAACKEPCDVDLLVSLASTTGGLVDDEVRRVACMFIRQFLP